MARDRRLFFKFFNSGLLDRGHLTIRQREIVIDRVTASCDAEYEWGVHTAVYADKAGLTGRQIASLVTEHILKADGLISSETLIAFRAFSRHDLERMFAVGLE
jgi:hypothetical protein